MRGVLDSATFVVLTLSAAAIATTVVHREFFAPRVNGAPTVRAPEYTERWRDVLSGATIIGDSGAPVTIVEFMDLECPYCKIFNQSIQGLRRKYGPSVAVALVHFPLEFHRFARPAARAAECALAQGRFEHFVDAVYQKQDSLGLKPWTSYASEAGVSDTAAFLICANATAPVASIDTGLALANAIGAEGTPTVIVNGWRYFAPPDTVELERVVSAILAGKEPFPGATPAVGGGDD